MTVPYNTGKVRIGSKYQPPRRVPALTPEELKLQRALLAKGPRKLTDKSIAFIGVAIVLGISSVMMT